MFEVLVNKFLDCEMLFRNFKVVILYFLEGVLFGVFFKLVNYIRFYFLILMNIIVEYFEFCIFL